MDRTLRRQTLRPGRTLLALMLGCATATAAAQDDYARWVDPFIGTGGHGHTHPAAVVPHGMIQPGPDTRWSGWDACSGYHYADSTLNGFAHTRLSGTGCADFGDFLLMPFTGRPSLDYAGEKEAGHQAMPYASPFSHAEERAEPGYYAVRLSRYGIRAELTATERAALHRYTFPASSEAGFILDLDYSIQEQTPLEMDVEVVDSVTVRAHRRTYWWAYDQELYFYARFSKPFAGYAVLRDTVSTTAGPQPRCKLVVRFATAADEQVMVRAAISAVDYDGARLNLETELPGWDFGAVRAAARKKWNDWLGRVDISPRDTVFYTALYHTALAPTLYCDVDGRYRGMDLRIHRSAEPYFTVFSLWDTFRALHPLLSLVDPAANERYIRVLLRKAEEGGIVPKWDCASNYTGCMIGYHFASLAADAWSKGLRGFDVAAAYRASRKAAEGDTTGIAAIVPAYKRRDLLPPARRLKSRLGYVPCDSDRESVAKALEYAYDDWCIALLARAAGDETGAARYDSLSAAWRQYYDAASGFMRGRRADGSWRTPFDPRRSEHRNDDYCEGNAWQWTWFVPHDIEGLMRIMGGREAFADRLDSLFSAPSDISGESVSADISGLIGQYAHGNEPSHHVAYLYNYAGQPWRTQALCDSILRSLYAPRPDGIAGNEDCGQMSAWYVLSALGLYQVCPGSPVWTLGRPLVGRAALRLPGGRVLTVTAHGGGPAAPYVQDVRFNGQPLRRPFLTHERLTQGGHLEFFMGDKPSPWGSR